MLTIYTDEIYKSSTVFIIRSTYSTSYTNTILILLQQTTFIPCIHIYIFMKINHNDSYFLI